MVKQDLTRNHCNSNENDKLREGVIMQYMQKQGIHKFIFYQYIYLIIKDIITKLTKVTPIIVAPSIKGFE